MQLKLNLNGSVKPFVSYLENFAKIRTSILLELDIKNQSFVAKVFTEDRASVCFSAITFEQCNISISQDSVIEDDSRRIKLGLVSALPKFIHMVKRFGSETNNEDKCVFDIVIDYEKEIPKSDDPSTDSYDYIVTKTTFKSGRLKMKIDGYSIKEFRYLPDETFYGKVFRAEDPVTFKMSPKTISSIIGTSDIISVDKGKDALVFFVEDGEVMVCDKVENGTPNFVYGIAKLGTNEYDGARVAIFRQKFIEFLKGSDEEYNVTIGYVTIKGNRNGRLLFDSEDSMAKIVIAGIVER